MKYLLIIQYRIFRIGINGEKTALKGARDRDFRLDPYNPFSWDEILNKKSDSTREAEKPTSKMYGPATILRFVLCDNRADASFSIFAKGPWQHDCWLVVSKNFQEVT